MKHIILIMSLLPILAFAQMPAGFDAESMKALEKKMQSMMSGMAQVGNCMDQIDQSKLDALGDKAEKLEGEISKLCKSDQRSAAQNKAKNFSREMNNNKEMKKMKKCMEPMGSMMKSMPFEDMFKEFENENKHVCDRY